MAYERNRFRSVGPGAHILGSVVEFDASRRHDKSGGWRLAVYALVLVAIAISFISSRGCFSKKRTVKVDAGRLPVSSLVAICVKCGSPANHSHRLSKSSELVVLGETDIYEPLCRHCYNAAIKEEKEA